MLLDLDGNGRLSAGEVWKDPIDDLRREYGLGSPIIMVAYKWESR